VRDAACVGVAHARFGEVPAAFIVLETAMAEDAALTLLDDHCRRAMERWKRPRLYVFVDAVPRTAAKRTKMAGEMRRILDGITLAEADGITTLSRLRAAASRT
jgi:acyl-coenzyme A synthetase/AMP-(fatty) acid ligase